MPANVVRFERLMYLSLVFGVVVSLLDYDYVAELTGTAFAGIGQGVAFVFMVLLIWLIARKAKNWARWTLLVLYVVGIPLGIPALSELVERSPMAGGLSALQWLIQAVALYMVFSGDAPAYFARQPDSGGSHLTPP